MSDRPDNLSPIDDAEAENALGFEALAALDDEPPAPPQFQAAPAVPVQQQYAVETPPPPSPSIEVDGEPVTLRDLAVRLPEMRRPQLIEVCKALRDRRGLSRSDELWRSNSWLKNSKQSERRAYARELLEQQQQQQQQQPPPAPGPTVAEPGAPMPSLAQAALQEIYVERALAVGLTGCGVMEIGVNFWTQKRWGYKAFDGFAVSHQRSADEYRAVLREIVKVDPEFVKQLAFDPKIMLAMSFAKNSLGFWSQRQRDLQTQQPASTASSTSSSESSS